MTLQYSILVFHASGVCTLNSIRNRQPMKHKPATAIVRNKTPAPAHLIPFIPASIPVSPD
ncbi:hypothetical protein [Xanthomonas albilineans]|uniref:hypothetical protein n=1 Tax=Xanthomonas albilineans TaxID=29447 RepID=UPI000ACC9051|nr:hypothetical protein [Xanthomonas albilineans]